MAKRDVEREDVRTIADLLRLAALVRETQKPRVLRVNNRDIGVLTPVAALEHGDRRPSKLERDYASFERQLAEWRRGTSPADDPWEGYDPDQVIVALRASAGALEGVDREQLLNDLRAQRGQRARDY